jgi:hypothetical protein
MMHMLLWLYTHISRACFKCFICFHNVCCKCFYQNVAFIANRYIASVCSERFMYFSRMLQLFHLSVAKVDLDIRVEEA